jgi:hypothetical protein
MEYGVARVAVSFRQVEMTLMPGYAFLYEKCSV